MTGGPHQQRQFGHGGDPQPEVRAGPEMSARRFQPQLTIPLFEGWFAKESITVLAPDGQANVIASSEPLDLSIDTGQYAQRQGDLLRREFPGYREYAFEPARILGGKLGYIRRFEWFPPDGVPVTQIQLYYAEQGRGYTATATAPTTQFGRFEVDFRQLLAGIAVARHGHTPADLSPDGRGGSSRPAKTPLNGMGEPAHGRVLGQELYRSRELWAPAREGLSMLEAVSSGSATDAKLPDDVPLEPGAVAWAPGALAGVLSKHAPEGSTGAGDVAAEAVITVLDRCCSGELDRETLLTTYSSLTAADGHGALLRVVADWGQTAISQRPDRLQVLGSALREFSGWLIEFGTERRPVQAGILLASLLADLGGHTTAIAALGRHAEFAYEACTALGRGGERYEPLLLELASCHKGWGRIHAIEQLSRTRKPHIRRWLLQDGFRNDVMWEYTACQVAVRCDLKGHLRALHGESLTSAIAGRPPADAVALLDGARDILSTLLEPHGPAGDISDYADAGAATVAWLEATQIRAQSTLAIEDYALVVELAEAVDRVVEFAEPVAADDRLDDDNGFTGSVRSEVWRRCRILLSDPAVPVVAMSSLALPDARSLAAGTRVAQALGLDTVTTHLARVRADPEDTASWWQLTQHPGDRAEDVIHAALELLPEDCVDRGGRATIGPAPGPHLAVGFLLQHLVQPRPRTGWPLLERCLRSPLVGLRVQALTALLGWPRPDWPMEAIPMLRQVLAVEQDQTLRTRLVGALSNAE